MILDSSKKTVFILGAGASKPYGFPLGGELNEEMLARLRNDPQYLTGQLGFKKETVDKLVCVLEDKQYPTFDQLLEKKPQFRELGAVLIASSLLPKESISKIRDIRDWYDTFFTYCGFGERAENLNSVVTFNYDRSLQYTLRRKIISLPDHKEEIADKLRMKMQFLYPHGTLEAETAYPYGEWGMHPTANEYVVSSAKTLKIISDDLINTDDCKSARVCIDNAEQVVVLGFGYARPTLSNLFHGISLTNKRLFLCLCGFQHNDAGDVVEFFKRRGCDTIEPGAKEETAKTFFSRILTGETYALN